MSQTENQYLVPVSTLLTPTERQHVDIVGEGYYRTVHRDNVDDLIQDLKTQQIQAILISVPRQEYEEILVQVC